MFLCSDDRPQTLRRHALPPLRLGDAEIELVYAIVLGELTDRPPAGSAMVRHLPSSPCTMLAITACVWSWGSRLREVSSVKVAITAFWSAEDFADQPQHGAAVRERPQAGRSFVLEAVNLAMLARHVVVGLAAAEKPGELNAQVLFGRGNRLQRHNEG